MIPTLISVVKFALGGGAGVLVGYGTGLYLADYRRFRYRYAAAVGYACGFWVNYLVNFGLGNINA